MTSTAAGRWAAGLARWRIPDEVATAPPPQGFPVQRFADIADLSVTLDSPSRRIATAVLPEGGSVLDVGCGAGAGSLPLVPPAGEVIGVDVEVGMLDAFVPRVRRRGAAVTAVLAPWPEAARHVPTVDVVVSHHLVYAVADLAAFAHTLTRRARRRVVLHCGVRHPLTWTGPFWQAIHGIERPDGPDLAAAAAVLTEAGIEVTVERSSQHDPLPPEPLAQQLAFLRRRLRIGPDRDDELRRLLAAHPRPQRRDDATLWWDAT